MTQSVEGRFDPAVEAAVRAEWEALAGAGLPSLARHTGPTNRPHVTLLASGAIPEEAEAGLAALAGHCPLQVRLGALGCFGFGDRVVLFRLVVPSAGLLALQADALRLAGDPPGLGTHLTQGAWAPHVTLAHRLPVAQLPDAFAALGPLETLVGEVTAVERWDSDAKRLWRLGP